MTGRWGIQFDLRAYEGELQELVMDLLKSAAAVRLILGVIAREWLVGQLGPLMREQIRRRVAAEAVWLGVGCIGAERKCTARARCDTVHQGAPYGFRGCCYFPPAYSFTRRCRKTRPS